MNKNNYKSNNLNTNSSYNSNNNINNNLKVTRSTADQYIPPINYEKYGGFEKLQGGDNAGGTSYNSYGRGRK